LDIAGFILVNLSTLLSKNGDTVLSAASLSTVLMNARSSDNGSSETVISWFVFLFYVFDPSSVEQSLRYLLLLLPHPEPLLMQKP
jgi:hypothetical protein